MKSIQRKNGFVLLTTVFLIAIAGLIMAGLARRSMLVALDASAQKKELQVRWGSASCQRVAFQQSANILSGRAMVSMQNAAGDNQEVAIQVPLRYRSAVVQLGSVAFQLDLADEQAKANVNLLFANRSEEKTRQIMRQLDSSGQLPDIYFRPSKDRLVSLRKTSFHSWGQVFEHVESDQTGSALQIQAATNRLTLWGPAGKVHFAAADDEVLREVANLVVNPSVADDLVELRAGNPGASYAELIQQLDLTRSRSEKLEGLLMDSSKCQSLWIAAYDERSLLDRKLIVRDTIGNTTRRVYVWDW